MKGGLRTGEKVGASKKRVHFSDDGPVSQAHMCADLPEDARIGAATNAKSCQFVHNGSCLVDVFAKASITCDVNSCGGGADFRQFGANAEEKSCHFEEEKSSSSVDALEKAVNTSAENVTEFISHESPCTPPSCGSYGLALLNNGKPNHSNSHVHKVQRKLTFVVGAGDQMSRKCGFTNKKTLSRVQNYKVVPESEGAFSTAFLGPHLNVMHTFGSSEGACHKKRCAWITSHSDAVYVAYHDEEWGVAVHEDRRLFELLVFAGAQTEIAWSSILSKREAHRDAFAQFDPAILATYDAAMVASLKSQRDIMKSEARVQSIVSNAKLVMKIVEEFGSFSEYIWRFVSYKPIVSKYKQAKSIPTRTAKSEAISKDLQKRGMRHAGPMVVYSFMQAAGLANDHLVSCFRHPCSSSPSPSPSPSLLSPSSTKPLVSPLCC